MIRHFVRCPQGLYPCFRSRPLNPPRTIRCAISTLLRHRVTSPRRRRCQRACFPFRHRQNLIRIPSVQIGSFQLQGIWLQQVFSCKEILSRKKKKKNPIRSVTWKVSGKARFQTSHDGWNTRPSNLISQLFSLQPASSRRCFKAVLKFHWNQ